MSRKQAVRKLSIKAHENVDFAPKGLTYFPLTRRHRQVMNTLDLSKAGGRCIVDTLKGG